jgi:hypothetical protein
MILRLLFRKGTSSPSRHYSFREDRKSQSASSTQEGVAAEFPRLDVAVARVVVRRLVKYGLRKPPGNLLILPDHVYEDWLDQEAVRYLQEQKALRQSSSTERR